MGVPLLLLEEVNVDIRLHDTAYLFKNSLVAATNKLKIISYPDFEGFKQVIKHVFKLFTDGQGVGN